MAEIGKTWLASAKTARKARQWQTAYSAMLQAQQSKAQFSFIECAKLIKATNEPLRALKELENSMKLAGILDSDVLDLTIDEESMRVRSKVHMLMTKILEQTLAKQSRLNFCAPAGCTSRSGMTQIPSTNYSSLSPKWTKGWFMLSPSSYY